MPHQTDMTAAWLTAEAQAEQSGKRRQQRREIIALLALSERGRELLTALDRLAEEFGQIDAQGNTLLDASQAEIARAMRCSHDTAMRAALELEASGFLRIVQRRGRASRYEVLWPVMWAAVEEDFGRSPGPSTEQPSGYATLRTNPTQPYAPTLRNPTQVDAKPVRSAEAVPLTEELKKENKPLPLSGSGSAADVPIPESLDTPEFRAAWSDWLADRRERRKPVTPRAARMQLRQLVPHGPVAAVAKIELAIANGWQGIVYDSRTSKDSNHDRNRSAYRFDPTQRLGDDI